MTSSIKPHPETFPGEKTNVLIGTGERAVRLGIATIYVYSLGLYVDSEKCRDVLSDEFRDADHDALLTSPDFYPKFVDGKFKKSFNLVFCRSISKSKLAGGFAPALKARCDDESHVERFLDNFCMEDGVHDNDDLTIICHDDGETIKGYFTPASTKKEQALFEMKSPGEKGMWKAFQNLYFDNDTAVPTIRHGSIALLPNLLATAPKKSSSSKAKFSSEGIRSESNYSTDDDDEEDITKNEELVEVAIEEQFVKGVSSTKCWKDFAGRSDGKAGYKFGDFTRGVTRTVFTAISDSISKNDCKNNENDVVKTQSRSVNIGGPNEAGTQRGVKDAKDIQIEKHIETINSMLIEIQKRKDKISKQEDALATFLFVFVIWLVSDAIWSIAVLIANKPIDLYAFAKDTCLWIIIKLLVFLVLKPVITSPDSVKAVLGKWRGKLKMD